MAKWKLWLKFILTELHKNQQWYIQVYVALSWSTSLQGLHIILGEINKNYVKADPKVYHDYDKLRSTCVNQEKEISVNEKVDANSVVQLCLLNIRSLRKQSCVRHDVNHWKSDILAFTDTQLLPRDGDSDISWFLLSLTCVIMIQINFLVWEFASKRIFALRIRNALLLWMC